MLRGALLLAAGTLVGACSYYPGFEELPNVALYHIKAKDVVGGLKCAMFGFLYERQYLKGGDTGTFEKLRFELDPSQQATIQLTLNTSTLGGINYSKIDAAALANTFGVSSAASVIAIGSSTSGLPFPSASASVKGTNQVDLNLTMDQTIEQTRPLIWTKKGKPLSNLKKDDVPKDQNEKFLERCQSPNEEGVVIDYLGIKQWLVHLLSEEEGSIWRGTPEVYLDNIVLTTTFDIQADVSFGVTHFLRLVPVVGVPTVEYKPDNYHTLKVTFHGYKNTPSPITNPIAAMKAEQEARDKLRTLCEKDAGAPCGPDQLLLEKIIQSGSGKKG
jgi:hypothetical protein